MTSGQPGKAASKATKKKSPKKRALPRDEVHGSKRKKPKVENESESEDEVSEHNLKWVYVCRESTMNEKGDRTFNVFAVADSEEAAKGACADRARKRPELFGLAANTPDFYAKAPPSKSDDLDPKQDNHVVMSFEKVVLAQIHNYPPFDQLSSSTDDEQIMEV